MLTFRDIVRDFLSFGSRGARDLSVDRLIVAHRSRREAELRGARLLSDHLSREQRSEYGRRGYFHVTGSDTGKRYRIQRGYQMNVEELDERGRWVRTLCFAPEGRVPLGDLLLAQKMALELFEADALRIAKQSPMWDAISDEGWPFVRGYGRR
jgi:hypothetical protein